MLTSDHPCPEPVDETRPWRLGRRRVLAFLVSLLAGPVVAQEGPPDQYVPPGTPIPKGWYARRSAFYAARESDHGAVVFLGDSITQLWTIQPAFPELKVANRGISGDTSFGLKARLRGDVLDLDPRAVVILIGTNDLAGGAAPATIAANITDIVDTIRGAAPQAPIVLCRVMPRRIEAGKFPDKIRALNALIDKIPVRRGRVILCDTWSPFAGPDGGVSTAEFPDGLHPGPAGYAKWTAALRPAFIRAGLIAPTQTVRAKAR